MFYLLPTPSKLTLKIYIYIDKLSKRENIARWNMLSKLYKLESRWMNRNSSSQAGKVKTEMDGRSKLIQAENLYRNTHAFETPCIYGGWGNGCGKKQGNYESLCEEESHSLNFEIGEPHVYPGKRWRTRAVVSKNVAPKSAAAVSPENLLEM